MLNHYSEFVIRFRWLVVFATIIFVGLAAQGMGKLQFSNDYRVFFSEDNPQAQAFEDMQNTYDKSDNVLFIVTPKEGSVFSPSTLASIEWLTEEAWQTPYSTRVDSITNFQHTKAFEDDLEVADLIVDSESLSNEELEYAELVAQSESQIQHRLLSKDSRVTGVNVNIQLPGKALTEVPEVVAFVRNLAKTLEAQDPNLDIKLSGVVMMNNAFAESSMKDMMTLVPLMFLVVVIMLGILLRSFTGTLASVAIIFISIVVALGAFGWSGRPMTGITASAPTIILTMAVADCVHLLVTFFWGMRHGKTKHNAIVESIRVNMLPIFITSITTAIGFMSMNFSEVPPISHLGNIVAIGVMIAFVLSVSTLPALMMILPVRVKVLSDKEDQQLDWTEKLSHFVVRNNKTLLGSMVLISIAFIALVPRNQINDEFVKYFDESMDFRQASDYSAEHLIGPYTLEYSLQTSEEGAISEPEYLAKVDEFVSYLRGINEVTHVFTLTDTMKRLNKNMHGDDEAWMKLPEERELAAQYLLLYEMSLPYGLDLNNQINVSKSATRVTVTTDNMSTNDMLALEKKLGAWLDKNASEFTYITASTNLMFAHIGHRNASSLVFGILLALFLISMILIAALRSFKIGLISLVPNLVPAGIAFGIWGVLDGQVGMSVSVVVGMTLGIVVDDTVHFLSKYLRARREKGLDTESAIHYAFSHVGKALAVTTAVLVAGFLMLTISTFKMNSDMGLLTSITIITALIIDFFLLPPLLLMLDKKKFSLPEPTQTASIKSDKKIAPTESGLQA